MPCVGKRRPKRCSVIPPLKMESRSVSTDILKTASTACYNIVNQSSSSFVSFTQFFSRLRAHAFARSVTVATGQVVSRTGLV